MVNPLEFNTKNEFMRDKQSEYKKKTIQFLRLGLNVTITYYK